MRNKGKLGKRTNLGYKIVFKTYSNFFTWAKGGFQNLVSTAIIHEPTTFTIKYKAIAVDESLPGNLMQRGGEFVQILGLNPSAPRTSPNAPRPCNFTLGFAV